MKFLVMIYCDDQLLGELPPGQFDTMMRGCLDKADELKSKGILLDSQKLEAPVQSRTMRIRQGNTTIVDGPFAETKEYLGGFNLIEAKDMDEAQGDGGEDGHHHDHFGYGHRQAPLDFEA